MPEQLLALRPFLTVKQSSPTEGLQKITDQLDDNRSYSDEEEQRQSFFCSLLLNAPLLTKPTPATLVKIGTWAKNAASVIALVLEEVRPRAQRRKGGGSEHCTLSTSRILTTIIHG